MSTQKLCEEIEKQQLEWFSLMLAALGQAAVELAASDIVKAKAAFERGANLCSMFQEAQRWGRVAAGPKEEEAGS